jgi:CheY-like chemotaxis protein
MQSSLRRLDRVIIARHSAKTFPNVTSTAMPDVEARSSRTRVLLAEDDPISAAFLTEALQRLGMQVEWCADGEQALSLARSRYFSLLFLDCQLPGRGAKEIVLALRGDDGACSRDAPVLASSADVCPRLESELRAAGCQDVLTKPLSIEDLEQALDRCLSRTATALVDDQAGLKASGNDQNLQALRQLFMQELDTLLVELPRLAEDPQALRERLHRLRASCGFCGAMVLSAACGPLAMRAESKGPQRKQALEAFRSALEETLDALRASSRLRRP